MCLPHVESLAGTLNQYAKGLLTNLEESIFWLFLAVY